MSETIVEPVAFFIDVDGELHTVPARELSTTPWESYGWTEITEYVNRQMRAANMLLQTLNVARV